MRKFLLFNRNSGMYASLKSRTESEIFDFLDLEGAVRGRWVVHEVIPREIKTVRSIV